MKSYTSLHLTVMVREDLARYVCLLDVPCMRENCVDDLMSLEQNTHVTNGQTDKHHATWMIQRCRPTYASE